MSFFNAGYRQLFAVLFFLYCISAQAGVVTGNLKKWHTVVIDFAGPEMDEMDSSPNPFLDYRLQVTFTGPSGVSYNIPGYFDGDGNGNGTGQTWRVKFSPDESGNWSYSASFREATNIAVSLSSSDGSPAYFDGDSGSFTVSGRDANADGFLKSGWLEATGKHFLQFREGDYWIKGGMNSPENILGYNGFDNTPYANLDYAEHIQDWQPGDPDWDSPYTPGTQNDGRGIIGMLNYLSAQHLNSIYFMPMNIGADGKDSWPYASESIIRNGSSDNDNVHFDISKMAQWSIALDHAQRKDIFLHFVLSDKESANKNELDNATLGTERKLFYREMIARFGHFNALQWNISEEYNLDLPLSPSVIKVFAGYIQDVDPYDHPITVHNHGNTYVAALGPFVGDTRFNMFSVQTWQRPDDISMAIEHFRTATSNAGQKVPVAIDECIGIDQLSIQVYRKRAIWDTFLSGGGHELFARYADSSLDDFRSFQSYYQSLWYARRFVTENLPFWDMQPADQLVSGENPVHGGAEVLATEGSIYAIYLPAADQVASLSMAGIEGTFLQRWYNPRTGQFEGSTNSFEASASVVIGAPPADPAEDWVTLIQLNEIIVPEPVITPVSGSYFSTVDVTLSAGAGLSIYYTTDGSTPTSLSTPYSTQFALTTDTLVKAIAIDADDNSSAIVSTNYLVSQNVPAPLIAPVGGNYFGSVQVSITSSVAGGSIYYTTDGNLPTIASTEYSGPIVISSTTNLQAITALTGFPDSAANNENFTIQDNSVATAYWPLDENTGLTVSDSAGTTGGTVVGATWVGGVSGAGLAFDGVDDHMVMTNTPQLDITGTALTLSAWIFPLDDGVYGGSRVISKRTDSGGSDVYAMYTQSGALSFRIDGQDMTSNYVFSTNQWVHVTMVYNGIDKRIYINGQLDSASPQAKSDPVDSSVRAVHIGMREEEARQFNGRLDEIRIFDTALTATEIATLDIDGDGLSDYQEVFLGLDPKLADTDADGLSDFQELNRDGDPAGYKAGIDTDPLLADTDDDGYLDGREILLGSNPLDAASLPVMGDINDDGDVTAIDLLIATQILLGSYSPTAQEQQRWDLAPVINGLPVGDNQNTLADLLVLQQKLLGIIISF